MSLHRVVPINYLNMQFNISNKKTKNHKILPTDIEQVKLNNEQDQNITSIHNDSNDNSTKFNSLPSLMFDQKKSVDSTGFFVRTAKLPRISNFIWGKVSS